MKKGYLFFILSGFLFLLFYSLNNFSFGYGTKFSHPEITREIINLFSKNFPEKQISQEETEWLIKGSVEEDTPIRYVNHFYDPVHSQPWLNGAVIALTALDWAQSPNYQKLFIRGDQSWQKAIASYLKGDKQASFIALGHVLHLIEDVSVPEHTRNDTHIPYINESPYEDWVEAYFSNSLSAKDFYPALAQCSSLSNCFYRLASYSNNKFFSADTINDPSFSFPIMRACRNLEKSEAIINGRKVGYYCNSDENYQEFRLAQVTKERSWFFGIEELRYKLDDNVLADYFPRLVPQAISSGAEVLKLFFEEAEKQKNSEQEESWWEKTKDWFSSKTKYFTGSLINTFEENKGSGLENSGITIDENAFNKLTGQQNQENNNASGSQPGGEIISLNPNFFVETAETQPDNSQNSDGQEAGQAGNQSIESQTFLPENEKQTGQNEEPASPPLSQGNDSGNSASGSRPPEDYSALANSQPNQEENISYPETYATSTLFSSGETVATTTAIFTFFSSEEDASFQCQLDNATSSLCVSPQEYQDLANGDHVFKVWAIDALNNQDSTPADFKWSINAISENKNLADHLVISEIKTSGENGADDEWVELYNPTSQPVDISQWSVQYRGSSSSAFHKKNFNPYTFVTAYGYFLIANFGYSNEVPADLSHNSFQLSSAGGSVFVVNGQEILTSATSTSIVDKLSYGTGGYLFPEGKIFLPAPLASQSLERKANASSTAFDLATGNKKWQGNGYDTDNNKNDFILQNDPTPQNSSSLTEPRDFLPAIDDSAYWPMSQKNAKRQAWGEAGDGSYIFKKLIDLSASGVSDFSPPAISHNKIFLGANNGLYSFDLKGHQLWFLPTEEIKTAPLLTQEGIIYAQSSKALYSISDNGFLRWKYLLDSGLKESSLNIDKNGIIYITAAGKLYAFYPDGKIKWSFDISQPPLAKSFEGKIGSVAIDNEREKIYLNIGQDLYALNLNGALLWDFQANSENSTSTPSYFSSPSVGNNGLVYVSAFNDSGEPAGTYALNPDGTSEWFNPEDYIADEALSPAVGIDGVLYFSGQNIASSAPGSEPDLLPGARKIFALDSFTGEKQWEQDLPDSNISSPVVTNHNVFVTSGNELFAFDLEGNLKWSKEISDNVSLSAGFGALGPLGNLYFTAGAKLYRYENFDLHYSEG
jgi:hypothetical protein